MMRAAINLSSRGASFQSLRVRTYGRLFRRRIPSRPFGGQSVSWSWVGDWELAVDNGQCLLFVVPWETR